MDKASFWVSVMNIGRSICGPWMVIEDHNELVWHYEKEGGSPWNPSRIRHLRDFVDNNDLLDLGFSGPKFTWARNEDGVTILQERLDRFLVNEAWIDLWPDYSFSWPTYRFRPQPNFS